MHSLLPTPGLDNNAIFFKVNKQSNMQKQGEKRLFLSTPMGRLYKPASITQNRFCGNNKKNQTTTKNTVKIPIC